MRARLPTLLLLAATLPGSLAAQEAVPTEVAVHVVAADAKLIGSAVGGVQVRVLDAGSGAVLAEGMHEGGTGDTQRIMAPVTRDSARFGTEGAAGFTAHLALTQPTRVRIEAAGPMGHPEALARASTELWLLPGQHLRGDGVVLVLHGYIVERLAPDGPAPAGRPVAVRARVRLLCSCPTAPEGTWRAGTVRAEVHQGGALQHAATLTWAGEASTWAGTLPALPAGSYELLITASDPDRVNMGLTRGVLVVQ